jgi:hypothetical protein
MALTTEMSPGSVFLLIAHIPLLTFFNILLWLFIILRLRSLQKGNVVYPSRWRTVSAFCITTTGVLSVVHLAFWICTVILNFRLRNIGARHGILATGSMLPNGQPITANTFTPSEMATMVNYCQFLKSVGIPVKFYAQFLYVPSYI